MWCRCEVEYKSSALVLPFDVLLYPSQYFAAAYPCFAEFAQHDTPQRMQVKEQAAHITVEASLDVTKKQFGRYLRVFRELYGDKATLDRLVYDRNDDYFPKRLKPLTAGTKTGGAFLHDLPAPTVWAKLADPACCPSAVYAAQSNGA